MKLTLVTGFVLVFGLLGAIAEDKIKPLKIVAGSAVVIDALTGQVLFAKNPDTKREIASTQKMMTSLLIVEAGDLDATVEVNESDVKTVPKVIGLEPGQSYTRRALVEALLIVSGNDVARCLGRDNAGSCAAFAEKMTRRAKEFGMSNTRFLNPSGLTREGQYSTARDLARLAWMTYRKPWLREMVRSPELEFTFSDGRKEVFANTNELLTTSPYCRGMKTGFTNKAGRCLVSCGTKDDRQRIVVVLGSSWDGVWSDSEKLLHWSLHVNPLQAKGIGDED